MITQITYERLYNLGNYESERISATATVDNGNTEAAYAEAKQAVEAQHQPAQATTAPASYSEPPASDKQRAFISTLQDRAGWSSEDLLRYAADAGIDLTTLTKQQASDLIERLQKEARQEGIVSNWAKPLVTPGNTTRAAQLAAVGRDEAEDLPF